MFLVAVDRLNVSSHTRPSSALQSSTGALWRQKLQAWRRVISRKTPPSACSLSRLVACQTSPPPVLLTFTSSLLNERDRKQQQEPASFDPAETPLTPRSSYYSKRNTVRSTCGCDHIRRSSDDALMVQTEKCNEPLVGGVSYLRVQACGPCSRHQAAGSGPKSNQVVRLAEKTTHHGRRQR